MSQRITRNAAAAWMASRGWRAHAFQREVWRAMSQGESGLLHANTGAGKTLAVWLGILQAHGLGKGRATSVPKSQPAAAGPAPPLTVLWITPMRALAADTVRALVMPAQSLQPQWTIGLRTGDTPPSERARQDRRLPTTLVSTPESLSLLMARAQARDLFSSVSYVVVDEWHELLASKRGVQLQLALARLRTFASDAQRPAPLVWGLSATLGDTRHALDVLCPPKPGASSATPVAAAAGSAVPMAPLARLVRGAVDKKLVVDTLIPDKPGAFSWAGHLGARMRGAVARELAASGTSLVFTNVRSQAEIWYRMLLDEMPDLAGQLAVHHGSLDREVRDWVEAGLKAGSLRAVVATSSLDLGVDFLPVERVLQIGSAKGVARVVQRAGRSGHAPGRTSRITLVPTNTLELIEAAAARQAIRAGVMEERRSPDGPLDVLVQHLVTCGLGGGFEAGALLAELRGTWAYRELTQEAFDWVLRFCGEGGDSLRAYPEYQRLRRGDDGLFRVPDAGIARRHRQGIGTIVAEASVSVATANGRRMGQIEEGFIARLRPGDCFVFAGQVWRLLRVRDMVAVVEKAPRRSAAVPAWSGGRMPLSTQMADAVRGLLDAAARGIYAGPEMRAARPMLQMQAQRSHIPRMGSLLIEHLRSDEGWHWFVYPFGGRQVHLGLASLFAWRLARDRPNTFSLSVNDYGLELLASDASDASALLDASLFSAQDLSADIMASINAAELAQRRFREIARIAGLVHNGLPGAPRSARQLQASSGLFFEVFRKYDPANRLLEQARQEAMEQELEVHRLALTLERMRQSTLDVVELSQPSPLCVPLMVERFRETLSTEQLTDRLERLIGQQAARIPASPS